MQTEIVRFIKRAVRQGTWPILQRYRVLRKILDLPQVSIPNEAEYEIHAMVCENDALMLHWALRSFLHHCDVPIGIVIHDDGTCSAETLERFRTAFVGAQIVPRAVAAETMARILSPHRGMFEWWKSNVAATKWIDCYCLGRAEQIIFLDSDVLFFARPSELFHLRESAVWMKDVAYMLHLDPEEVAANFGGAQPPQLNTGLGRVPRRWFDLEVACRVKELIRTPSVQSRAIIRGLPKIDDMTFHAVITGVNGGGSYLSEAYAVATEPGLRSTVAKHYVCPQRFGFFEEGIPRVAKQLEVPLAHWLTERG